MANLKSPADMMGQDAISRKSGCPGYTVSVAATAATKFFTLKVASHSVSLNSA
eukprot:CAMPEP_0115725284 /NCGR_PEP_ID=MMETSP0272-20121206/81233_1 /TAXON_ID=71861 /ORGANISM="Scrippsiella trochoidea, Strain CCMP3099" /LENGTH=52 /DNA_ID=CAMNT_0003168571 /DNA_START=36 /DNA_END=190 /DNA_ORIENTATION=-